MSTMQAMNIKPMVIGLLIGVILTLAGYRLVAPESNKQSSNNEPAAAKPLYWVAPMDANYRRDKPGKSPMGMDLVPVYADDGKGPDAGAGTIRISPDVVNNLGVRTSAVRYQSLNTKINTVGYVAYNQDKLVHIHPRVQGWIEKLYVKAIGDPVQKGQALYDIYSPELVNAQEELLLAMSRKNSRLLEAAKSRLSALQIPKQAVDKLKQTKKVQQRVTFYAPQNGVVENLKIREGYFVKPGSTIMSIGDLSQVWLEAEVFERQAGLVKKGTAVTMTLDYLPGQVWQGKVDYIYPTLDAKTRTVKVRLRFDNSQGLLKPNMFAQIVLHAEAEQARLLIPKEALIRTGHQDRVVLALGEGSFKSVAVSVGRFDSKNVEILAGLKEGDHVVTSAQFLLDSESSKSSDFIRMHHGDSATEQPNSVWVSATIASIMAAHQMLTLEHEAIPEWDWPAMVMDFSVADDVDFSDLYQGLSLHVEVTKTANGDYQISNLHIPDGAAMAEHSAMDKADNIPSATVTGTIKALMLEHNMVTISRAAIEKWQRPAATMDFISADSVSLAGLSVGMQVKFTFEIRDGEFVIVAISPVSHDDTSALTSAQEVPAVDHSHH
ncbi:membrane fusion protein, Cu(I)/Ag(I) efflux system [Colwellia chukchiensis]|uniref:Membrane fusion protein, Cu(I)/Ag(I) efflux system n=1 Tax=Colwellia chukchiensis TaxID=641665 RepID=A0A1H7NCB8_9GAMM|nr:efflux RND transporter periplasmic adaptor subunit [Colwellia chukchiensis]SEL21094.1 membrane fusion protein, Cu(I)/Ag(I) efflux system [Colwellia chukchiensis]